MGGAAKTRDSPASRDRRGTSVVEGSRCTRRRAAPGTRRGTAPGSAVCPARTGGETSSGVPITRLPVGRYRATPRRWPSRRAGNHRSGGLQIDQPGAGGKVLGPCPPGDSRRFRETSEVGPFRHVLNRGAHNERGVRKACRPVRLRCNKRRSVERPLCRETQGHVSPPTPEPRIRHCV